MGVQSVIFLNVVLFFIWINFSVATQPPTMYNAPFEGDVFYSL